MESVQVGQSDARTMITFKAGNVKFTYRIAGIAIHDGHVLFQQSTIDPNDMFWFLPGGRAELGESAEETLEREMMEELGLPTKVERPLFLVENFFPHQHEVGFYFLMTFPEDSHIYQGTGPFECGIDPEANLPLIFTWLPIKEFDHLDIKPAFLRSTLQKPLPEHFMHVVNRDL